MFSVWHRRTVEQNRNDGNTPEKCLANLDTHEVIGIVEPPLAGLWIASFDPAWADKGQHDLTLIDPALKSLDEIDARRNRIDVHEQAVARQHFLKSPVDHPSLIFAIVAAIANEHLGGHRVPFDAKVA